MIDRSFFRLCPASRVQHPVSSIPCSAFPAMPKIPVASPMLRTSSLSQGYLDQLTWPVDMPVDHRKVWCRLLAQAIGPLRAHLQDTTCPLVVPGSAAERELEEARHEIEEKRLQLFKLVTRITEVEITVGKRLEELEKVAGTWAASAEAMTELEMIFCKQKLENMRRYRTEHKIAARPVSSVQHSTSSSAAAAAGEPAGEAPGFSVQHSTSSSAATAGEAPGSSAHRSMSHSETPTRGRDRASQGCRIRHHSPLMIPVQWGFARDAPTGMLPSEVLHEFNRGPDACIIRRTSPDAHPQWRLLAPNHEALQEFRPRT